MTRIFLLASIVNLFIATSFVTAAERFEGAWGGRTPTSVTFLGKKKLRYCFKNKCQVRSYKGNKNEKLNFSAGGKTRIILVKHGTTYDASFAADGKKVVATAMLSLQADNTKNVEGAVVSGNTTKELDNNIESEIDSILSDKETIRAVQSALSSFGYRPGSADGINGNGTKREIKKFRRDAALTVGNHIDEPLVHALGIRNIESNYDASIFVVNEPSHILGKRLEKLEKSQIVDELAKIIKKDRKRIDLVYSKPKSIVFVIYSQLNPGVSIRTYASNIIGGEPNSWSQSYRYTVDESTPTAPMIIINEFETGNPMYLVHKLFINNNLAATRLTRAR